MKSIPNNPNYIVDTNGNIFSVPHNRLLKLTKNTEGHLTCGLTINGLTKVYKVHHIVANLYIDNPENKDCILHVDGDKTNNKVSNLLWVTRKEIKELKSSSNSIKNNISHKTRKVRNIDTEVIFNSITEAASNYASITADNLLKTLELTPFVKCGGFHWEYV